MTSYVTRLVSAFFLVVVVAMWAPRAYAAGAVEMQVERVVNAALEGYNQAMESGELDAWLKYFTSNIRRQSPTSAQNGAAEFQAHYRSEFDTYKARWTQKKMLIMGRSAAVLLEWDGVHKASGAAVKVDMAVFMDLASSGQFDNIAFVFDPSTLAKIAAAAK